MPEEGAKAKDLLDRLIAAKGGLALLQGIKSIKAVTSASMTTPRGAVEAETTTYLQYPDHVRVETKLPQGTQVQVYDGEHAWVSDPRGVFDVPIARWRDMVVSLKRDTVAALLAAAWGDLRSRLLPDVKDEHGPLHHALELSGPSLDPLVFYVDPQTYLIAKQTYVASVPGQPLVEELFSDYRSVDGLEVAFAAEVRRDGQSDARAARQRHQDQPADRRRAVQTSGFLSARLLLSCGEPSGDLYAGALVRELRALDPGVLVSGLGGPEFAAAGGTKIDDYRGLAVTGLTEAMAKLPRSWSTLRRLVASAERDRPDALVVVDFPDFNFPLARQVKRLGIPVVYYISPQIWAWRPGRLKTIREIADLVLVIFPFEEAIYRDGGVPVEFVGHPLVECAKLSTSREAFLAAHGLTPVGADGRDPPRQPAERGGANSAGSRGRGRR